MGSVIETKTLLVCVDCQNDFMNADGALCVPGAEDIKENVGKLIKAASDKNKRTFVTKDQHEKGDIEFEMFGEHCMIDTDGAELIDEVKAGKNYGIFTKSTYDIFTNEEFKPMLEDFNPDRVILFGVATDICVKATAEGIIDMDIPITLVGDAIAGIDKQKCIAVSELIFDAGGEVLTTEEVINGLS